MLFSMDIGNTCSNIGIFKGDNLVAFARMSTDHHRTEDQYAIEILSIMKLHNINRADIHGAIFSSVVPNLSYTIKMAIKKALNVDAISVGPGVKTGLNIKIDNPSQLGADLVCAAVAAIAHYPLPCIVLDLGTATTISYINEKGEFLGGSIAPGIGTSLEALVSKTSMLQMVDLENPDNIVGTNTISSIKSGIIFGNAAMMDGMVDRIEEEYGKVASIIATGGRAPSIIKHCKKDIISDQNLLMEGLRLIYNKNVK
ncbi:MAG: type III pantothenate kinase [Clostridia bacterium]|nr:type III pantothenate kinase [Clostridia bacterium]